jgi:hypothetical protein
MVVAASDRGQWRASPSGVWWAAGFAAGTCGGTAERRLNLPGLAACLPGGPRIAQAAQVHGASLAVVHGSTPDAAPVPGCDALLTAVRGLALAVRTADCLPILAADPVKGAVGIAHVGWRGLAAGLPTRLVAAFRHSFRSRAADLRLAIGPGIRDCCYEVGPEFADRFGPFLRTAAGRRTCDLAGAARAQLAAAGVAARQVLDSRQCTACDPSRWYSTRREGQATGRLLSFVLLT